MEGPDHKLSADQNDLKIICNFAKNLKLMKGSGNIYPSKKELCNIEVLKWFIYNISNIPNKLQKHITKVLISKAR
jgi:sialic acid synthase SpsE